MYSTNRPTYFQKVAELNLSSDVSLFWRLFPKATPIKVIKYNLLREIIIEIYIMVVVQSLWIGDQLSLMEIYSIKSFLNLGMEFHLYTYNKVKGVPKGTKIKDANKILPQATVFKLQETFLPFSDIWRYKLLYEKGGYWVDLDIMATKVFDFKEDFVFASERTIQKGAYAMKVPYVYQICVLKAPPKSKFYKELFETCMDTQNKGKNKDKIKYMRIMRKQIDKYNYKKYVKPPQTFCHLDWWYAKDAFMPKEKYDDKYGVKAKPLDEMFTKTYAIHFWRNLVTNKYKLDLNAQYDPRSLWEKTKRFIDK